MGFGVWGLGAASRETASQRSQARSPVTLCTLEHQSEKRLWGLGLRAKGSGFRV